MKAEIQQIISNNETEITTDEEDDEDEEKLLSIVACALHDGCRVIALVYSIDDEDAEEQEGPKEVQLTQKDIINKYARIINEKLPIRMKEANEESERITREKKTEFLGK